MPTPIESLIVVFRSQRVILDHDLAEIYGVPTKAFNQAVKRNLERFPEDFMFQLTDAEWDALRQGIHNKNTQPISGSWDGRSQIVTAPLKHNLRRALPHAFTEHGAIMASMVLNSPQAVRMSVYVVRAFAHMREQIAANATILQRLAEMDRTLLEHDGALRDLWAQLEPLLAPPEEPEEGRQGKIGFHAER